MPHRGVVVLKDRIEGKKNVPEDCNPREVFSQVAILFVPLRW